MRTGEGYLHAEVSPPVSRAARSTSLSTSFPQGVPAGNPLPGEELLVRLVAHPLDHRPHRGRLAGVAGLRRHDGRLALLAHPARNLFFAAAFVVARRLITQARARYRSPSRPTTRRLR